MAYHKYVQSFNAGELSPFLANRTDVAKYEAGCQTLENMILLPYGGAMRRPGTQWMGRAKFPDKPCRMIGFNFSVTTNFILEFGHLYVRFWTNGVQVVTPGSPTVPLEKATPYPSTALREVQYCQINDLMYLTHPDYPVQKLTRLADDNWTFAEVAYRWPPFQDENIQNITITPSGTGGNISLSASGAIFSPEDVGSTWQIGHNQAGYTQTYTEVALGATSGNSPAIRIRGPWSFTSYGTWQGEIRIHRTIYRTGVSEYIRTWRSNTPGQLNIASTGNEDEDCSVYIAFFSHGVAGSSSPTARLEFSNAVVYGLVQMYSYANPYLMYGTVTWGLAQTSGTTRWSEPAFNQKWGYPRTACLHDQRLIFGGTRRKPLSLHGSQIDDYENFQRGANADHAFLFTLSANESNPINWMVTQTSLLIGTAGNEWSMGAVKEDEALGPGNVQAKQQSSFGSSYLQARVINEVILFSQRQSHKIRELTYSFQKDGWVAPDLTILAAHIAGDGFVETAFAQQPDAIFWCVTLDGSLVGMTYERDQNVVGWHRHNTQGAFESVASIYGGNKADEIWFSVKRHIDGADVRYIERFDPNFRPTLEAEDKEHYWYLDCGYRTSGGATGFDTITFNSASEWANWEITEDSGPMPTGSHISLSTGALTNGYIVASFTSWGAEISGGGYEEDYVSTVWLEGEKMELIERRIGFDDSTVSLFGMPVGDRPAGSYTLTMATSTGQSIAWVYARAFAYSGVNQSAPTGVAAFAESSVAQTSETINIPSVVGDLTISMGWGGGSHVAGTGQTDRSGTAGTFYSEKAGAAGTTAHSYSHSTYAYASVLLGVALKQAPIIPKISTITGLGHLKGCTVGILGDGANQPTRVVDEDGAIEIQEPSALVLVGLPYTSKVKPMNLNIPVQDTMQGRKVRIHKVTARFYKSLTCKFSSDDVKFDEIFFRDRVDLMDTSPSVFTGDRQVYTNARYDTAQAITLMQDRPFPLCVLAMIYWSDAYGD